MEPAINRTRLAIYTGLVALLVAGLSTILFIVDPETIQVAHRHVIVSHFEVLTAYISLAVALLEYRLMSVGKPGAPAVVASIKVEQKLFSSKPLRKDWIGALIVSFAVAWMWTTACQAVFHFVVTPLFPTQEVSRFAAMVVFTVYGGLLGFVVSYSIVAVDDF